MEWLDLCRRFIAIDTTLSQGTRELVEFISERARQQGFSVTVQVDESQKHQCNIIIRSSQGIPAREFMMQSHLDTAEPGAYGLWDKTGANPFEATIHDGLMYGLGTCNAKLDFVCKWEAARSFLNQSLAQPFVLVGTFGAEQGRLGAIKLMRRRMVHASRALVGEPTGLRLWHAGKGIAVVEISVPFTKAEIKYKRDHDRQESSSSRSKIFSGKAGHSVDPQLDRSAINRMFEYISQLPESLVVMEMDGGISPNTVANYATLEFDVVGSFENNLVSKIKKIKSSIDYIGEDFKKHIDSRFNPPVATLNIGMVRTFEDHVKFNGCCRLPPTVALETYEGWMQELRKACDQVDATFSLVDYKPSFETPQSSSFVKECQQMLEQVNLNSMCGTMAANNEASIFSHFGVECLVFGPGEGKNSHSSEEHVAIEDLKKAKDFYRTAIERFCR